MNSRSYKAPVIVTGPFDHSGTHALVYILKLYLKYVVDWDESLFFLLFFCIFQMRRRERAEKATGTRNAHDVFLLY